METTDKEKLLSLINDDILRQAASDLCFKVDDIELTTKKLLNVTKNKNLSKEKYENLWPEAELLLGKGKVRKDLSGQRIVFKNKDIDLSVSKNGDYICYDKNSKSEPNEPDCIIVENDLETSKPIKIKARYDRISKESLAINIFMDNGNAKVSCKVYTRYGDLDIDERVFSRLMEEAQMKKSKSITGMIKRLTEAFSNPQKSKKTENRSV